MPPLSPLLSKAQSERLTEVGVQMVQDRFQSLEESPHGCTSLTHQGSLPPHPLLADPHVSPGTALSQSLAGGFISASASRSQTRGSCVLECLHQIPAGPSHLEPDLDLPKSQVLFCKVGLGNTCPQGCQADCVCALTCPRAGYLMPVENPCGVQCSLCIIM